MSFESVTDIYGIYAIYEETWYHVSSLDVQMDLGGTAKASFIVLGKADNTDKLNDLSDFAKGKTKHSASFSRGSWVTLAIEYEPVDDKDTGFFELFSGRVSAMSDSARMSGVGLSIGRGYSILSDLEFVDKLPLGSLYMPKASGTSGQFRASGNLEAGNREAIIKASCRGASINIAKLTADLIDLNTLSNKGSRTDKLSTKEKITDRIEVDIAPTLSGITSSEALGTHIANLVGAGYASVPPMSLFKSVLSRFFLVCAPRRSGLTEVVENNGWKKNKKTTTVDIGYDLITGISLFNSFSAYPGFDGVAVDLNSGIANRNSKGELETKYFVCTEAFDELAGRSKLLAGEKVCHQTDSEMTLVSGNDTFTVGRVRVVQKPTWMNHVDIRSIKEKQKEKTVNTEKQLSKWAQWLGYGVYAEINRTANRASVDLRLAGYKKLADRLGDVLSFNVPGSDYVHYGRLTNISVHIGVSSTEFMSKATATFDCVRDEIDNNNLCIDFSLYETNSRRSENE